MITPKVDTGIPLADYEPTFATLAERTDAALAALVQDDREIFVSDDDIATTHELLANDQPMGKEVDAMMSAPGVVIHLKSVLNAYDQAIVRDASQIRRYVTNRLVDESNHKDAKIRMKALELLGKISDVGLFTDKTEITMRHRPTEELEQMLRERLTRVIDAEEARPAPDVQDVVENQPDAA